MPFDPRDPSLINFAAVAPLLALGAGALVVLVLDLALSARRSFGLWFAAALGSCLLAGYYLVPLWQATATGPIVSFSGAYTVDRFTVVVQTILLLAAVFGTLLSFTRREEDMSGFLALLLWAALGSMLMAGASSLMTIFLGLEILSLALYVLIGFARGDLRAREGAFKYFTLGSLAGGLLLYGMALVYGAVGSVGLSEIAAYVSSGGPLGVYFIVGTGLMLAGFAFKLALVPFHHWAPDAYEGAPSAVTAYMSVGTKVAAFAALARFVVAAIPAERALALLTPLLVLALLSMVVGALGTLRQQNVQRLIAYSGIAHAGYLFLAFAGVSAQGISAATFYLLTYLFTNMGLFSVVLLLTHQGEPGADLASYRGLFYRQPLLATLLSLFLFSLIGVPITGGFLGKLFLIQTAVSAGNWLLIVGLIATTGISAYAYLRVMATMIQRDDADAAASGRGRRARGAAASEVAATAEGAVVPGPGAVAVYSLSDGAVRIGLGVALALAAMGTLYLGLVPGSVVAAMQQLLVP